MVGLQYENNRKGDIMKKNFFKRIMISSLLAIIAISIILAIYISKRENKMISKQKNEQNLASSEFLYRH